MKKLVTIWIGVITAFILPQGIQAATTLPSAENGVIKLTEDVTLSEKYVVSKGETVTIDLNGYTLTGPSDNYTIDNEGTLTIIDSANNGSIQGVASSASCIRNAGTLIVTGVTIESVFVAIKNDTDGNLTVNSSTISSSYESADTGTIMNWSTATINDSIIIASRKGAAIYATSDATNDSTITLNNCTAQGKYAIYARRYSSSYTTTPLVKINGGTYDEKLNITQGGKIETSGTITANNALLKKASSGTTIILASDIANEDVVVPEGVTLKIPSGVTVSIASNKILKVLGTLEGTVENANVYNEDQKTYYPSLAKALSKLTANSDDGTRSNEKLILQSDITESTTATPKANKNVTIDLNGYTLTGSITNPSGGNMTITDSSTSGTGTVTGIVTNNGTGLTINGGNYLSVPVTSDGSTTTLNDGTYPVDEISKATIPEDKELVKNSNGTYSIEYKKADYSKINSLMKQINNIDKSKYTDDSIAELEKAISNIVYDKKLAEQSLVDEMASDLEKAFNNLVLKSTTDSTEIDNPATSDNILMYFVFALISMPGVLVTGRKLKKANC